MRVIDLQIDEMFEADNNRFFRLTIQVGALKIQGRLTDRSLVYLIQGKLATVTNAEVGGWVKPVGAKRRVEVDAASLDYSVGYGS